MNGLKIIYVHIGSEQWYMSCLIHFVSCCKSEYEDSQVSILNEVGTRSCSGSASGVEVPSY